MDDLSSRSILVVFNSKAKDNNDVVFSEVGNWSAVEGTSYADRFRAHLPEDERYEVGTVLVKQGEDVGQVWQKLKRQNGIQGSIPPSHCLNQHEW